MNVLDWLKAGEEFLTPEESAKIREIVKGGIAHAREMALAKAAHLDAQFRALETNGKPVSQPETPGDAPKKAAIRKLTAPPNGVLVTRRIGTLFTAPLETDEQLARLATRVLVERFVSKHPGCQASDVIEYVTKLKPGHDPNNVHSALYRLSKDDGPLERRGDRGSSAYFRKEGAQA